MSLSKISLSSVFPYTFSLYSSSNAKDSTESGRTANKYLKVWEDVVYNDGHNEINTLHGE
jgi:hypothetical protein